MEEVAAEAVEEMEVNSLEERKGGEGKWIHSKNNGRGDPHFESILAFGYILKFAKLYG